ncbi:MAG TPA: hypothetical protein VM925_10195 [Labilithrix sp.]|nr:hypothetical protein [Labilithrix sp.]
MAPSADHVSATAIVAHRGEEWSVALTTEARGVVGRRSLSARSCEGLARATALVLAFTVDPDAAAKGPAETREYEGDAPHDAPREKRPPPRVGERSMFLLGGGAAAGVGSLPGVSLGPELAAGWGIGPWRIGGAFVYFPPAPEHVDASRGGAFSLLAVAARGCRTWAIGGGALDVGPCLAFEVGSMQGSSSGIRIPGSGTALWSAGRAGLLGAVGLGRSGVWLSLAIDAAIPITRPKFEVDGIGIVFQPSPAAGRASLGAELRF